MFVAFLGYISILKSGWNIEILFCCLALELFHCLPQLFHCLPLWKRVRLHGKKLQNATNFKTLLTFWATPTSRVLRQRSEQSIHRRRKKIMCQLFFLYSRLLHTLYIVVHLDQKRPVFEQVWPYQKHEAKKRKNGLYSTCANICPRWYFCSNHSRSNGTLVCNSNSIALLMFIGTKL